MAVDPQAPAPFPRVFPAEQPLIGNDFPAGTRAGPTVYKSTDGGQSWVKKSAGLGAPGTNMRAWRIIRHRDGTLFCLVTALRKDGEFDSPSKNLLVASC